jgi:periplasmic divalent cation tolerance protein
MGATLTGDLRIIYCPCPSRAVALDLGRLLVRQQLVACANVLPEMCSVFMWEGALNEAPESLLLAKTTQGNVDTVIEILRREHPYDCPAILVWPAQACPDFAAWVGACCAGDLQS